MRYTAQRKVLKHLRRTYGVIPKAHMMSFMQDEGPVLASIEAYVHEIGHLLAFGQSLKSIVSKCTQQTTIAMHTDAACDRYEGKKKGEENEVLAILIVQRVFVSAFDFDVDLYHALHWGTLGGLGNDYATWKHRIVKSRHEALIEKSARVLSKQLREFATRA